MDGGDDAGAEAIFPGAQDGGQFGKAWPVDVPPHQRGDIRPSTGGVADCFDNAVTESFFATLETELLDRHHFPTHAQAKAACFDFIEGFYNPRRRHSTLGMLSPAEYERRNAQQPDYAAA